MENFKNENIINIEENEDKNNDQDNDDISISTQLLNTKQENNEIKKNDYYNDDLVIDWGTPKYHRIILKERIEKKNKENAKEITGRQFLKRKRNKERQMKKRKHKIEDKRAKSNYYQIKEEKENDIRRKSFAKFDDIKLTECLVKGENSYINDFLDSYRDNMQKINEEIEKAKKDGNTIMVNDKIKEKREMRKEKKYIDKYCIFYYNFIHFFDNKYATKYEVNASIAENGVCPFIYPFSFVYYCI